MTARVAQRGQTFPASVPSAGIRLSRRYAVISAADGCGVFLGGRRARFVWAGVAAIRCGEMHMGCDRPRRSLPRIRIPEPRIVAFV